MDETSSRAKPVKRERSPRITLKDIALRSGYTVNTVSHALRGKSDISAATRRKIVALAQEMGYVGNTLASSLRSGRSGTIAIILSDVVNPHFGNVVDNIESYLRAAGYTAIVLCTGDVAEQECRAVRTALSHLADGVLICPSQLSLQPIMMLRQSGIPFVIMGRQFEGQVDNQVLCDDEGGAYLLTQYLLEQGHRRVLYIGGDAQFSSQRERESGYRRAMAQAGLGIGKQLTAPFERYQRLEERGALIELIDEFQPTAVFAFRDAMAWTLINQLRRAGMRVPEDLSVAGFDYIAQRLGFLSPLTTVAAQGDTYAIVAVKRLMELLQKSDQPPQTIRLAMRLIDAQSTVRPLSR